MMALVQELFQATFRTYLRLKWKWNRNKTRKGIDNTSLSKLIYKKNTKNQEMSDNKISEKYVTCQKNRS